MRRYWLMDQHGEDGPTALVETDGSLHIVAVVRFGPGITELDDQQQIHDQVIGRLAPTMRPFVDAATVDEEGVEPHPKLRRGDHGGGRAGNPARGDRGSNIGGGRRTGGGPSRSRSRGDR